MISYQHVLRLSPLIGARVFFVTDIHGHYSALSFLLESVQFNPAIDLLIVGGDLVDRGPESHLAINWLRQPWFHSVRGNHDDFCLVSGTEGVSLLHYKNGGAWYGEISPDQRAELINEISGLPYLIEITMPNGERIGVVHAELFNTSWDACCEALEQQGCLEGSKIEAVMLTSRNLIYRGIDTRIQDVDYLYVGHTAVDEQTPLGNIRYCDTGAGKANGQLSLFCLNDHRMVKTVDVNHFYDNLSRA